MRGRFLALLCSLAASHVLLTRVVLAAGLPDLAPVTVQFTNHLVGPPDPLVTVQWSITNQGPGTAFGSWFDSVMLASNGVPDSAATSVDNEWMSGPLDPGTIYWHSNSFQLQVTQPGSYSLIFFVNNASLIAESTQTNNRIAVSFSYDVTPVDLTPIALQIPTVVTGAPNPTVTIAWGITNSGPGYAYGSWVDNLIFSTNATWDTTATPSTVNSSFEQGPVPAGGVYWRTNSVRLPVTQDGTYYLTLFCDEWNSLFETQTNNNQVTVPITLHILPPDLAPLLVQAPKTLTTPPRPLVNLVWAVTNQGPGQAIGDFPWFDTFYLSTNSFYDSTATFLIQSSETGPVDPGGVYWRTNQAQLPVVQSGTYYLLFAVNSYGTLFETNQSNNLLARPISVIVQPPDIALDATRIPAAVTTTPNPSFTFVWGVTNLGIGAALGVWEDQVSFSTNAAVPWWNPFAWVEDQGPLNPNTTIWHTNTLQLPITSSGIYYLDFTLDQYNYLYESDKSNNLAAVPVTFTIQPSDLAPVEIQAPPTVTGSPNPTLHFSWAVTNAGIGSLPAYAAWGDAIYFSTNGLLDGSQIQIWSGYTNGPLAAGATYRWDSSVTAPAVHSGLFYLIFVADSGQALFESNEANNVVTVPIAFTILQPDLSPVQLVAPANLTGPPNPQMTVSWCVTNLGVGPAAGDWQDYLTLSTDSVPDFNDPVLTVRDQLGPVVSGGSYWVTNSVTLPVVNSGSYFLILQTDPLNSLFESNPSNNTLIKPINITIQPPDLAPVLLLAPAGITSPPNPSVTLIWGVTNQGIGPALSGGAWSDAISISTNTILDQTAIFVASPSQLATLASGSSYWTTNTVRLPILQSGLYHLFINVDAYNQVYEPNKANNLISTPIQIIIQPPDLKPLALQAPSQVTGPPNPTITFAWGVTNQGLGAAGTDSPWADALYLSSNPVLDYTAKQVSLIPQSGLLQPGEAYWSTNSAQLPVTTNGSYFLFLKTDANDNVFELNETNNVVSASINVTVLPPDLAPFTLQVQTVQDGAVNPQVRLVWGVTNQGSGPALGYWMDQVYLTKDTNSPGDQVSTGYGYGPVPSGGTYWITNSTRLPIIEDGTYYLVLKVNSGYQWIYEANNNNNTWIIPLTYSVKLPDLSPVLLSLPIQISGPPNPQVSISWGITNQGAGPAISWNSWSDQFFISTNPVLDASASFVGYTSWENGPISAGHTYWRTRTLQLPVTESGTYYLFLETDAGNVLPEANETNNLISARFTFNAQPPDLAPVALLVPSVVTGAPNPLVTVVWGVTNQGLGLAQGSGYWADQLFLSTDAQLDSSDILIAGVAEYSPLAPSSSYWRTNTVRIPIAANGTNFLIFKTDSLDFIPELNESNNVAVAPFSFNLQYPDLVPFVVTAPRMVNDSVNALVTVVWGITNQGAGPAYASPYYSSWTDAIYLSHDSNQVAPASLPLAYHSHYNTLQPGQSSTFTNTFPLSSGTGDYYLLFKADDSFSILESDTNNNLLAAPITLNINQSDLSPIFLKGTVVLNGLTEQMLEVVWGVTNQGPGTAQGGLYTWTDTLYLSPSPASVAFGSFLGSWTETGPIPPGGTYWRTNLVQVPVNGSGTYYLTFGTDAYGSLNETSMTNNSISVPLPITVASPDLAPIALLCPTSITSAPNPVVPIVWGVTNQGSAPATALGLWGGWYDMLYLSTNAVLDGSPQIVISLLETNILYPGQSYWRTNFIRLPVTNSAHYVLTLLANAYGLSESNLANNSISTSFDSLVQFPDLAVSSWQAPTQINSHPWPSLTFVVAVTNQGTIAARGWADALYLSQTPFLDDRAVQLGSWGRTHALLPGQVAYYTNTLTLPIVDSADYYLFFVADDRNTLGEQQLSNNTIQSPLSLDLWPSPDLTVSVFQVPALVVGTATPSLTTVSYVLNQGLGPAVGPWTDSIIAEVSMPGSYSASRIVHSAQENLTLQPGQGYWRTNTFTMPQMQSGQYQISFWTDVSSQLYETDRDNNSASATVDFLLTAPAPLGFEPGQFTPNNGYQVRVYGTFGTTYLLQVSTNLTDWYTLFPFTCTDSSTVLSDTQADPKVSRFYRIVTLTSGP